MCIYIYIYTFLLYIHIYIYTVCIASTGVGLSAVAAMAKAGFNTIMATKNQRGSQVVPSVLLQARRERVAGVEGAFRDGFVAGGFAGPRRNMF